MPGERGRVRSHHESVRNDDFDLGSDFGYPCTLAAGGAAARAVPFSADVLSADSAGGGSVSGKWPAASSLGLGSSSAHRSVARGHRVRNRQPLGGLIGDGGSPSMTELARAAPGSVDGIESSSALV